MTAFDGSKQRNVDDGRKLGPLGTFTGLDPIFNIDDVIATFPTTRFYGSKRRLLPWIHQSLATLPFNTVLDGFGGTASVSLLFKEMGKKVTFHDGLMCNTVSAHALLSNRLSPKRIQEIYSFIDHIKPVNGFVSRTFDKMYYTNNENMWLDGAATAIHKEKDSALRSVYFYCLFQACLKKRPFNLFHRANLNLRLNRNVFRSFGNLVTWETAFSHLMKKSVSELANLKSLSTADVAILPHGDICQLKGNYDLVYLDPPYVSRSKVTDDYLQRYHFLEGLSSYPEWGRRLDNASPIKSLKPYPYIEEWEDRRYFRDRLFSVIDTHKKSIVALSYVAGATPSEWQLRSHFRAQFRSVRVLKKQLSHALAKTKRVELLFIGSNI